MEVVPTARWLPNKRSSLLNCSAGHSPTETRNIFTGHFIRYTSSIASQSKCVISSHGSILETADILGLSCTTISWV